MKRVLLGVTFLFALLTRPVSATPVTVPFTFQPYTPALSAQVNQNFSTIYGWANGNVDNSNIGPNGIYPSQLIPISGATATLAGAFGYSIALTSASQTPLSIVGFPSQTADLLDTFNSGRTTKYVWVDSGGVLRTNQLPVFNGATAMTLSHGTDYVDTSTAQTIGGAKTFSALISATGPGIAFGTAQLNLTSQAGIGYDGQANAGLFVNTATGSSGVRYQTNGVNNGASANPDGSFTGKEYIATGFTANPAIGQATFSTDGGTTAALALFRLNSTGSYTFQAGASNTTVETIDGGGNVTATSYNVSASRPEWKTHIDPVPDPIAWIQRMPSYWWCYNGRGPTANEHCAPGEHRHVGPLALPKDGIVATRAQADDPKHGIKKGDVVGINESNLIGVMLAVEQQLAGEVDALKRDAHVTHCSRPIFGKVLCDAR